jgi:HK97 gp10 family phage protein
MLRMQVQGGDELLRKLRQLGLDVSDSLEVAAHAGAAVFVQGANQNAPAPEIRAETSEKRAQQVTVDVGPPDEKWYWRFAETGAQAHEITGAPLAFIDEGDLVVTGRVDHPGMAATPFLRPTFDADHDEATDAVGDELRRVIER